MSKNLIASTGGNTVLAAAARRPTRLTLPRHRRPCKRSSQKFLSGFPETLNFHPHPPSVTGCNEELDFIIYVARSTWRLSCLSRTQMTCLSSSSSLIFNHMTRKPAIWLDLANLLIAALVFGCCAAKSQTNEPPKKMNAETMRELRLKMLAAPVELGMKPTHEYPRVCGVLMDWPIEVGTVTIVSLSTGDASIYSTGTFGVLGGIGHEAVRSAAQSFVKVAEKHYDEATATKDYPYPKAGRVRFYLVCYNEVRTIDADLELVRTGKDKCSDLYIEGQRVITELRMITQKQKGEAP